MNKLKRFFPISICTFIVINLIAFLIFFLPYYVFEIESEIYEYIRIFLTKLIEFALPVALSTLLIKLYYIGGLKKALISAIYFSLPRAVYLLPYYYLYHIAFGYDSIESLGLSALVSVFGVAVNWAVSVLLFLFARFLATRTITKVLVLELPPKVQKNITPYIKSELKNRAEEKLLALDIPDAPFNFEHPITRGLFGAAFLGFAIGFLREVIDTISYLVDYAGYYRTDEIIYIMVCYLFLLTELFITHIITHFIFKKLFDKEL